MSLKKEIRDSIKENLIQLIRDNKNPYSILEFYKISRQTISKYLNDLINKNIILKNGKNSYELALYNYENHTFINKDLAEDLIYMQIIQKYENGKKENVNHILTYAFTEMLNNAIEHSESEKIKVIYAENYFNIYIVIEDNGVGIFKKIKNFHNLKNENEAIFELKKGKLTSDNVNHSGEGIFFTSKVVDAFIIKSFNKKFSSGNENYFYSFEQLENENINGTKVLMRIDKNTDRTTKEVFDAYTNDEYIFNKTEITVHLAKEYLNFPMVSRSLAKRILSNIEKFKVIFLDFTDIKTIGQGFADEIFRVYKNKNPDIEILPINTNDEIDFMINRAKQNN